MIRPTLALLANACKLVNGSFGTYTNDADLEDAIIAQANATSGAPSPSIKTLSRTRRVLNQLANLVNVAAGSTVVPFTQASTTIASGSNGAVLPQATINVASTAGFDTSGTLFIGNDTVAYTGVSGGNSFTGCTGGTGTLSTSEVILSSKLRISDDKLEADIVTQLKLLSGAPSAPGVTGLEA